jgi:hypothetical protein
MVILEKCFLKGPYGREHDVFAICSSKKKERERERERRERRGEERRGEERRGEERRKGRKVSLSNDLALLFCFVLFSCLR